MTSFKDTEQSKFHPECHSWISLPTIFKRTRGSQLQCKPQFKSKQESNIETDMPGNTQEAQSSPIRIGWMSLICYRDVSTLFY